MKKNIYVIIGIILIILSPAIVELFLNQIPWILIGNSGGSEGIYNTLLLGEILSIDFLGLLIAILGSKN